MKTTARRTSGAAGGGSSVNYACVAVATVNLIVSVMSWSESRRKENGGGDDDAKGGGSNEIAAVTAGISMLLLLMTVYYCGEQQRGTLGPADVNVMTAEAVASIDLPGMPPGVTDVHIKRTYKTEEIIIQNKRVEASGDAATVIPITSREIVDVPRALTTDFADYRTIGRSYPTTAVTGVAAASAASAASGGQAFRRTVGQQDYAHTEMTESFHQEQPSVSVQSAVAPPPITFSEPLPVEVHYPPPPPPPPTTVYETVVAPSMSAASAGAATARRQVHQEQSIVTHEEQMQTLSIQELDESHHSEPQGIPLPIRVGVPEDVVSHVDNIRVEMVPQVSTAAASVASEQHTFKTTTTYDKVETFTTVTEETMGGSMQTTAPVTEVSEPFVPNFEPSADVYFKLEEKRYKYTPDKEVTYQVIAPKPQPSAQSMGQCKTTTTVKEEYHKTATQVVEGAAMKQIGVQMVDSQPAYSTAMVQEAAASTCGGFCSKCQGVKRRMTSRLQDVVSRFSTRFSPAYSGADDAASAGSSLLSFLKTSVIVLLIIGLCMAPVLLFNNEQAIEEIKKIIAEGPEELTRGAFSFFDDVGEHPSAVGFAFGVIFITVILGSSYYYDHRDIRRRKSLTGFGSRSRKSAVGGGGLELVQTDDSPGISAQDEMTQ